MAEDQGPTPMK